MLNTDFNTRVVLLFLVSILTSGCSLEDVSKKFDSLPKNEQSSSTSNSENNDLKEKNLGIKSSDILSFEYQTSPIMVQWEVLAGFEADYEIEVCDSIKDKCKGYLILECASNEKCQVRDAMIEEIPYRSDYKLKVESNSKKTTKFIFEDELYGDLGGEEMSLRIRFKKNGSLGSWFLKD